MGALEIPQTLHAYTVADRWHCDADDRHLIPAGSEVGVVLSPALSSPQKMVWELRAIEISHVTTECLHYIARHRITFTDDDLRFDGGDFFGEDPPSLGSVESILKNCVPKPASTFC